MGVLSLALTQIGRIAGIVILTTVATGIIVDSGRRVRRFFSKKLPEELNRVQMMSDEEFEKTLQETASHLEDLRCQLKTCVETHEDHKDSATK